MTTRTVHPPSGSSTRGVPVARVLRHDAGARLFAAYWACLVVVDLTAGSFTVAGVTLVVAACSVRQRVRTAVALGVTGWLFVTGFLGDRHGELVVHGPADVVRVALLVTAATAAALGTRPRGAR
jgi:hypothetical protein